MLQLPEEGQSPSLDAAATPLMKTQLPDYDVEKHDMKVDKETKIPSSEPKVNFEKYLFLLKGKIYDSYYLIGLRYHCIRLLVRMSMERNQNGPTLILYSNSLSSDLPLSSSFASQVSASRLAGLFRLCT